MLADRPLQCQELLSTAFLPWPKTQSERVPGGNVLLRPVLCAGGRRVTAAAGFVVGVKLAHGSPSELTSSFPRQPGLVQTRCAARYSSGVKSFSQPAHIHSYRGADFQSEDSSSPFIQLKSMFLPGFGPPVFFGWPRAVTVNPPGSSQPGGGRPSPVAGCAAFASLRNEVLVSTVD